MSSITEKLDALLNLTDEQGRKLIYRPEDEGKIYLKDGEELRCLGRILIGTKNIMYSKFEDESNIFRKTEAWSINYSILKHVDHIHYETRLHDYSISKEVALEYGQFFHFIESTEKKVYTPIKYWNKFHKGEYDVMPKQHRLRTLFGSSWYSKLEPAITSPYMDALARKVYFRRKETTVYPAQDDVFRAFKHCPFFHTKVVIVGQDPYYSDDTADGLAFSYKNGKKHGEKMKSLEVIVQEVERSCYQGFTPNINYDLTDWAKQGVFLLNTILTVDKGYALSHRDYGWQRFTTFVLESLFLDEAPKVFMFWGNEAKALATQIEERIPHKHLVLRGVHPAADLHSRDSYGNIVINYPKTFSGCNHFKRANEFLVKHNRREIIW